MVKGDFAKISIKAWYILLFLILCFPRILQTAKVVLCLIILVFCFIDSRFKLRVSRSIKTVSLFWFPYAFLTLFIGVLYGNNQDGIIGSLRVNVFNFILYFLIIICVSKYNILEGTIKTVELATFYISSYNIVLIIGSLFNLNLDFISLLDPTSGVGIHTGYTHIISTNLSMTIITLPFLLGMLNHKIVRERTNRTIYIITIILCSIAMLFSGRRILWVALVFGGLCVLLFTSRNLKQTLMYIGIVSLMIIVGVIIANKTGLISFEGLYQRFIYAFAEFDEYGGKNVRNIQAGLLIDGFWDKPVFGNGAGAILDGYIRNTAMPWAYELSYHLVLFQSGLIGMILYVGALISIVVCICRIKSNDVLLYKSSLIVLIIAYISNATNPYFSSSFDFLIFLFLPVLFAVYIENRQCNNQIDI